MPIPNPSLDDLTFEQLIEEAKKKIPLLTKSWTNYNIVDPGITLLELLAWLTENQIYSLNKTPKRNYLKFLKLMGIRPLEAVLPKIDLTILESENFPNYGNKNRSFCLPVHTTFVLRQEEVIVETDESLWFIPSLSVKRCVVYSKSQFTEIRLAVSSPVSHTLSSSFLSQQRSTSKFETASFIDADRQVSSNLELFFFLFGERPQIGDSFYLQLEFASRDVEKEAEFSLSFCLFERDLPPVGQHGLEGPERYSNEDFKSKLLWEFALYEAVSDIGEDANKYEAHKMNRGFSSSKGGNDTTTSSRNGKVIWSPLEIIEDNTFSFSKSGRLTFRFPIDAISEAFDPLENIPMNSSPPSEVGDRIDKYSDEKVQGVPSRGQLWIRCRIVKNNFQLIPPRIEKILPNTVSCSFGYTLRKKLRNRSHHGWEYNESSNGLSNQIFEIEGDIRSPVLRLNYVEEIKENSKEEERVKWERVDDLISSSPLDKHYIILDEELGRIKFGDGEHGMVPPKNSRFEVEYKSGNKEHWWIEKGKIFAVDNLPESEEGCSELGNPNAVMELIAINFFPSSLGQKAESIREAIGKARQELTIPFKAVTISDWEYLAKNTPGIRVGKVRVMASKRPGEKNTLIVAAVPYSLSITGKRIGSSRAFQDAIHRHLEKHKLITTSIRMVEPKFVGVSVRTRVSLSSRFQGLHNPVKRRISASLDSYFSPFSADEPSKENGGWDFGRNVYRSEIVALVESLPEVENVLELRISGVTPDGFHTDSGGNLIIDDLNLVYLEELTISIV